MTQTQTAVTWSESPGRLIRDDGSRTEFRHSEPATAALREVFGPGLFAAYCADKEAPGEGAPSELVLVFIDNLELTHAPRGQARSWAVMLRGSFERVG